MLQVEQVYNVKTTVGWVTQSSYHAISHLTNLLDQVIYMEQVFQINTQLYPEVTLSIPISSPAS